MKILLLGANGMLGHASQEVFQDHECIGWDKAELDITDEAAVKQRILELKPEAIINAAAYTAVDDCEANEALATAVNGDAVGFVAAAAEHLKIPIVQISTDYVFAGTKKEGYTETDMPAPINAYGRSKLLGEQRLMAHTRSYYLVRTAWLYGPNGKNFVDTILKLAREEEVLKVVNDQFGSPTYTLDLARALKELLEKNLAFGIYHRTNEGVTSWYEFAKAILAWRSIATPVEPVTSAQFPRPAKRPKYSILKTSKLPVLDPWETGLAAYLSR